MTKEQSNKIEESKLTEEERKKQGKKGYGNPPVEYQIKPGEIRNPKGIGREKGTVNRSTVARKVLGMMTKPPEEILKNLKVMYPKFFEKKSQKWQTEFIITTRLAQRAMTKGDVQAYNALMDNAYGKENSDGKPTIVINLGVTRDKYTSQ